MSAVPKPPAQRPVFVEPRVRIHYRDRQRIFQLYARTKPRRIGIGPPVRCTPSPRGEDKRSAGKIIYDSVENVEAAILELQALGASNLTWYTCHRSTRRFHKHITSQVSRRHDDHD